MIALLAKMLGLSPEHAEASMHSERAARAVLTRRNLFAAGAALATGSVFSFGALKVFTYEDWRDLGFYVQNTKLMPTVTLPRIRPGELFEVWIAGVKLPGLVPWRDIGRFAP